MGPTSNRLMLVRVYVVQYGINMWFEFSVCIWGKGKGTCQRPGFASGHQMKSKGRSPLCVPRNPDPAILRDLVSLDVLYLTPRTRLILCSVPLLAFPSEPFLVP